MTYSLKKAGAQNLHLKRGDTVIAHLATGQDLEKLKKTLFLHIAEDIVLQEIPAVRDKAKWLAEQFINNMEVPND